MIPTVLTVFGTRPEAIKLAPLISAIEASGQLRSPTLVTAQHREMLDQVNELFGIEPEIHLDIMAAGQTLNQIASRVIGELAEEAFARGEDTFTYGRMQQAEESHASVSRGALAELLDELNELRLPGWKKI